MCAINGMTRWRNALAELITLPAVVLSSEREGDVGILTNFLKFEIMNITWNIKKHDKLPMSSSSLMYPNISVMKHEIEETGRIYISVENRTKTTLDIGLSSDNVGVFGVAHIPAGAEHLKYHHVSSYNYFHGHQELDYFKLTKKQGLNELKFYLERVIDGLKLEVEDLTVNMNIWAVEGL